MIKSFFLWFGPGLIGVLLGVALQFALCDAEANYATKKPKLIPIASPVAGCGCTACGSNCCACCKCGAGGPLKSIRSEGKCCTP